MTDLEELQQIVARYLRWIPDFPWDETERAPGATLAAPEWDDPQRIPPEDVALFEKWVRQA